MLEIHGVNLSPFVRKTRVALAEKGIEYQLVAVNPFAPSPEFIAMAPLRKVPVLRDGAVTVPDSSCIIAYLERRDPKPALYPADLAQFASALAYEEYGDSLLAETLAPVFIQRLLVPLMKGTPDQAKVQSCLERAPAVFDYLEGAIGDREWLVGDSFSVADIAIASPFVNWGYAGEQVDAARWPRLTAFLGRVHSRPSFAPLLEEEKASLASLRG